MRFETKIFGQLQRKLSWQQWQLVYILLSLSWLLAPGLNHHLAAKTTLISDFEDPGQPFSWLYRLCDILAALVLGAAVTVLVRRRQKESTRFYDVSTILLAIIALGSLIDDLFPSSCHAATHCLVSADLSMAVHTGESIITVCAALILGLAWSLKKVPWARTVFGLQLVWTAFFVIVYLSGRLEQGLPQFAYQVIVTLWIASIVPKLAGWQPVPAGNSKTRRLVHALAAWIFFGGFIAIVNSVRDLREISHFSAAYFGNNTAWLSQHGIAVGIVLMYISRHLWRGEYRAWQLTSLLLWLETLKYAALTPDTGLTLLYGLTALGLFVLRGLFDRMTSVEELRERLKTVLWVALAVIIALVVGVLAFRLKHHQDLDSLHFNFGQFSRHLFLVDMVNDLGPVQHRLLGQALNGAGLILLIVLLASLFRPQKPLLRPANQRQRQELLRQLERCSNSSEDYFKYWPQPKFYWWNSDRSAVVAYRVFGNVAFALADPIAATSAVRHQAAQEFIEYCRQHGWTACFLMVGAGQQRLYKEIGCKSFKIGASAVVDIKQFSDETARNKWWRWVLNKTKKQGWQYESVTPPHSSHLIHELRHVSDAWLQRQSHQERGFALGYFDVGYLQNCRLHLLRHEGRLIAFTNELPSFNDNLTATIDLMRFLPDYNHAMSALLAQTIEHLHEAGVKRRFDLGFVALASPSARTEQIIRQLGQSLGQEAVSARGLEQFKNKFAPDWANNYIAFDGDWIDLVSISRQIDALLRP